MAGCSNIAWLWKIQSAEKSEFYSKRSWKSVIKDALSNVPFIGNSSGTIKQEKMQKNVRGDYDLKRFSTLCATHIKKLRFSILMVTTLKLSYLFWRKILHFPTKAKINILKLVSDTILSKNTEIQTLLLSGV